MIWYLVMAGLYIGPFEEIGCKEAARHVPAMCVQVEYVYACAVDGMPRVYRTCPRFRFPEIMVK